MVATSYFYQVRFFRPNMIPLSTAKWDPKWFHDFRGPGYTFIDKNGVINGLRAEPFAPGPQCDNLCRGIATCSNQNPLGCQFLCEYANQLSHLNVDAMMERCRRLAEKVRLLNGFTGDPIYVFLVHEAPDNPCSERVVIQNYFNSRGYFCSELDPKRQI